MMMMIIRLGMRRRYAKYKSMAIIFQKIIINIEA